MPASFTAGNCIVIVFVIAIAIVRRNVGSLPTCTQFLEMFSDLVSILLFRIQDCAESSPSLSRSFLVNSVVCSIVKSIVFSCCQVVSVAVLTSILQF